MRYNTRPFFKLPLIWCSSFVGLLLTFLLLRTAPVYAEWVLIVETPSGMTEYVDPDTIRRKGDMVKMWVLFDYKTAQTSAGDSYFSSKSQMEIDCPEERFRILAFTWFSGNMGNGKVIYSNSDESKWRPVAPGSVAKDLSSVVCSRP